MIETIAVPELTAKEQMGFWRRVAIRGSDECWPWLGAKTSTGYGSVRVRGRLYRAHRIAWALCTGRGAELDGFVVLHTCDRPRCMSPWHLRRGTVADNSADMARKGRSGSAKLTADQVRAIRSAGGSRREISARYGVHPTTASKIRRRERWAWLD